MSKFNWQLADAESIALFIKEGNENIARQQINYYKLVNNQVMLDKVMKAKKYVALWKAEELVLALKKELST